VTQLIIFLPSISSYKIKWHGNFIPKIGLPLFWGGGGGGKTNNNNGPFLKNTLPISTPFQNQGGIHGRKQGGVSITLCGLAILHLKKYLKAKKEEELWKTQIFHHANINLPKKKKKSSKKNSKSFKNIIITLL
jgi:hypothetical protein